MSDRLPARQSVLTSPNNSTVEGSVNNHVCGNTGTVLAHHQAPSYSICLLHRGHTQPCRYTSYDGDTAQALTDLELDMAGKQGKDTSTTKPKPGGSKDKRKQGRGRKPGPKPK